MREDRRNFRSRYLDIGHGAHYKAEHPGYTGAEAYRRKIDTAPISITLISSFQVAESIGFKGDFR